MARRDELDNLVGTLYGHRRRRLARQRRRRRAGAIVGVVIGGAVTFVLVVGFGAGAALSMTCSLASLRPADIGANSFVYAADGSLLGTIPAERNRQPVPASQMSPWLSKATVAVEDRRFYQHGGLDYVGIARAFWADVQAGRVVEGGSTIDQELVRTLYVGSQQTFGRKIKEACLAIKLNQRWSRARILTAYLNDVYYGSHAYGVEAAAETYFSVHARSLNLPRRP
jgi:penicillin-binding protein 1A